MKRWCFLLLVIGAIASAKGYGGALDTYGFGARAMGMGAYTACGYDFSSVFYNPSAIAFNPKSTFGIGFLYAGTDLLYNDIKKEIDPVRGVMVGLSMPVGRGKLSEFLFVGLGIFLPIDHVIRVESYSSRTPQFIMYENRSQRVSLLVSAAIKPHRTLALSLGVEALADLDVQMVMDLTNETEPIKITSPMPGRAALLASITFKPWDFLSFGVSFRDYIMVKISFSDDVRLAGDTFVSLAGYLMDFYRPQTISGGIAYHYKDILTASFDLVFSRYSKFRAPVFVAITKGMEELGQTLNLESDNLPHFNNTLSPRVGLEINPVDFFSIRLGYAFVPTPVPPQKWESNYMDSDKSVLHFGLGFHFKDPLGVIEEPISLNSFLQVHLLDRGVIMKEIPAPAISFDGEVYAAGAEVVFRF